MERLARITKWCKYLLLTLLTIFSERSLAQNVDLFDYRYYRLFESAEELLIEEDSIALAEVNALHISATERLNRSRTTLAIRRGASYYKESTTLNGIELPYIRRSSMWRLQLSEQNNIGISGRGIDGERALRVDSIKWIQGNVGIKFRSRNMPYSVDASVAHRFKKGWSLAATMSANTGRDLFVKGLYGNALDIKALAIKEFNSRHRLSLSLFVAPSMRSTRSLSTAEAFRLTGSNLYNPSWGYQNGKIRSSRVRREVVPTLAATYEGVISERTKLDISTAIALGIRRYSGLDWFGTQTPMPDNYHYLPSYFADERDIFSAVEMAWLKNDTRYTQIDFDRLITSNRLGNGEALYAISDRVERITHATLRGTLTTKLEQGKLSYGIEISISNIRKYKQMRDLLGADYIVDLDYFLQDDSTLANLMQNNLNAPSRHIREDDRFGYDYAMRRNDIMAHASYLYQHDGLEVEVLAKVGYVDISRKGFFRKELFADSSFGVSRHIKLTPYTFYASGRYIINRNHLINAKVLAEAKCCDNEDLFLQSQYNNRIVDNPTLRQGYGAEVGYLFSHPKVAVQATLFGYFTLNDREVNHIYDDIAREYTDVVISNLDYARFGLEVKASYNFAEHFTANATVCLGRYMYIDNARVSIYSDAYNTLIADKAVGQIANLSLGNAPQIAFTAGLSYRNRGWVAGINANYQGLRYIEPSVTMRTERVLSLAASPEERAAMMSQERLRDAFTLDLFLSKSLYLNKFGKIYRVKFKSKATPPRPSKKLVFSVGGRNLIGSNGIVDMGLESSRIQPHRSQYGTIYLRHASRYLYAYPRTYEASVSFRF